MRLPLLLALTLTVPALAELPPEAYRQMEAAAPEALRLRVTAVNRAYVSGRTREAQRVEAKAEVLSVTRSAAGLAAGATIALQYMHDPLPEDMAGPGPVPIVRRTAEYDAYLRAGGPGTFAPAARSASFHQVKAPDAGADDDAPGRVLDVGASPAYLAGLGILLLGVLGGLAVFLKRRRSEPQETHDPEEDMATQFRVAPVLRDPED